jgi:hypothetical protein
MGLDLIEMTAWQWPEASRHVLQQRSNGASSLAFNMRVTLKSAAVVGCRRANGSRAKP